MFAWISENIATVGICLVLLLLVAAAVTSMVRARKKGKTSCGGSCACCPMDGACHRD